MDMNKTISLCSSLANSRVPDGGWRWNGLKRSWAIEVRAPVRGEVKDAMRTGIAPPPALPSNRRRKVQPHRSSSKLSSSGRDISIKSLIAFRNPNWGVLEVQRRSAFDLLVRYLLQLFCWEPIHRSKGTALAMGECVANSQSNRSRSRESTHSPSTMRALKGRSAA